MKNKLLITLIVGMFLFSLASISANEVSLDSLGTGKQNTNFTINQPCASATYMTLSTIKYPDDTIKLINYNMTYAGAGSFQYNFTDTSQLGEYHVCFITDGCEIDACTIFEVTSTGGNSSMFLIILLTCIGTIFFIASLVTPEEFFVYISGLCFLICGIYLMINGVNVMNDVNTRYVSYIYLGIGLLFTLGAYIYNWISYSNEED